MEIVLDKAREYILALKEAGNFTFEDMANVSGISVEEYPNSFSVPFILIVYVVSAAL